MSISCVLVQQRPYRIERGNSHTVSRRVSFELDRLELTLPGGRYFSLTCGNCTRRALIFIGTAQAHGKCWLCPTRLALLALFLPNSSFFWPFDELNFQTEDRRTLPKRSSPAPKCRLKHGAVVCVNTQRHKPNSLPICEPASYSFVWILHSNKNPSNSTAWNAADSGTTTATIHILSLCCTSHVDCFFQKGVLSVIITKVASCWNLRIWRCVLGLFLQMKRASKSNQTLFQLSFWQIWQTHVQGRKTSQKRVHHNRPPVAGCCRL